MFSFTLLFQTVSFADEEATEEASVSEEISEETEQEAQAETSEETTQTEAKETLTEEEAAEAAELGEEAPNKALTVPDDVKESTHDEAKSIEQEPLSEDEKEVQRAEEAELREVGAGEEPLAE
jgi:hypothetical protein